MLNSTGVIAGAAIAIFATCSAGAFAQTQTEGPDSVSVEIPQSDVAKLVYTPADGEEIDQETLENVNAFLASLTPRTGEISIDVAKATLNVPEAYYFLGAEDANRVLQDAWGNPPSDTTLGMIFPAGQTPFDDTAWGATVRFTSDGYVSDEEASKIDYDKMLRDLKKSTKESNVWRKENGYGTIDLVGWAEPPSYNATTNKLFWAKELSFEDVTSNTLNYDIRVLGRRGVLELSFIAGMDQLADIRAKAPAVLDMASFNAGSTYAEYQPGIDKKAAYGVAGLVGGAAIAKKLGLLGVILAFGKKFIVLIIAGFAAVAGGVRRLFGGNKDVS